jgi:NADH dehydrogenase (ubiquinone) 1 beta subcomplex subunit 8
MWAPDPPVIPPHIALRQFTIAWLGIIGLGYIIYLNVPERPAIPRQYPYNGLIKELGGLEANKVTSFQNM